MAENGAAALAAAEPAERSATKDTTEVAEPVTKKARTDEGYLDVEVTYVEIPVKDMGDALNFYTDAFGWDVSLMNIPNATDCKYAKYKAPSGKALTEGVIALRPEEAGGSSTAVTVNTPDLANAIEKVQKAGGAIVAPATPVAGMGKYAVVRDPSGNLWELWEKAVPVHPAGEDPPPPPNEHGSTGHFLMYVKDLAEAEAWYSTLFGWEVAPRPEYLPDTYRYGKLKGGASVSFLQTDETISDKPGTLITLKATFETPVTAVLDRIRTHGSGSVSKDVYEEDGAPKDRYMARIADPSGNVLGVMGPK